MPRTTNPHRRGFGRVDVFIAIAVIAILMAIIVPWIQQAREASRRTQCRGKLKQLGLALYNYHDTHSTYPPGYVLDADGVYQGWGWETLVLPYLYSSPLYKDVSLYFEVGLQNCADAEPFSRIYPDSPVLERFFPCPSDQGSLRVTHTLVCSTPVTDGLVVTATRNVQDHYARSNYFGVVGYLQDEVGGIAFNSSGEPAGGEPLVNAGSLGNIGTTFSVGHRYCDPANFRGVFGQNSWTKIKDIKDGTSNTLIVGERYTPRNEQPGAVGHGTWVGVPDCSTAAGLAMALGDTAVKLNAGAKTRAETTGFGSVHPGGAHFLFADGHVVFVKNDVAINVYRDLSTIADGRGNFCDQF